MQISELTTETSTTITEASIENPNSELFDAVKEGNLDRVKELIERGASINTKDSDGNTPLHLAAKVGNLSIVTYLVGEERAGIYAKNQYGQTPISLAAKNNHLDTVKYLKGIVPILEGIDAIVGIAGGVIDILQKFGVLPSEESKNFEEVFDALGKNYAAIEEVGNKVDRNFAAMKAVYDKVNEALFAIEATRLEMRQGFQVILDSIKKLGTIDKVSDIITFIDDFTENIKFIEGLRSKERVVELERNDNILDKLNEEITLGGKLRGNLKNIIDNNRAIPSDAKDRMGFAAFHVLYYGTQISVSAAFFVLEQYSYLADYYYNKGEIDKYNKNCSFLQLRFKNFKGLLFGQDGIIDEVIDILTRVQQDPHLVFVRDERGDVFKLLPERIASLKKVKEKLQNMEFPITENQPKKITGVPNFSKSSVTTPIGQWKEGIKVSYAIQYRENSTYSQIGEWSDPVAIHTKANPFLIIPGAEKKGRERLVFRKFNNGESPELVGVIKDKDEISFRDISRDVYDAALSSDEDSARDEIKVLLCNGADINETFDYGRKAIHAAAQSNNFNIALDLLSLNGTNINVQDANGYTPIYIAAEAGYVDFVKSLIDHGADLNIKTNKSNLTPLHIAAYQGYFPVVETLILSNKADINAKDKDDFTPLHSATFSDSSPTIRALLNSNNTDVNANSKEGLTPLHLAAIKNHGDATKILLESNRADVNAEAKGNLTALHFAASIGNLEVAKVLIEYNETNLNAKSANNLTPLHFATFLKKEDVALELLKAQGIDVNSKGKGGTTSLHIAAITGQSNVTSSLLQKGALTEETIKGNLTALHIAAMYDKDKIISTLIDEGHAKMEAKTVNGSTPLHLASFAGNKNATLVLLNKGADAKAYDGNGQAPIHVSVLNGKTEVVRVLIDHDSSIASLKNQRCEYPLHLAAKKDYVDVINCLVDKKADVNIRNDLGQTPLHYAAQNNSAHAIKCFAEKEASLNIKDNFGYAPLHLAAKYNCPDAVKALAEKGADLNIRDNDGFASLHLAARYNCPNAIKAFAEISANLNVRNNDGLAPLHLAARYNCPDAIKALAENGVIHLNIIDNNGLTPLHLAARYHAPDAIKVLSEKGADLNIKDNYGQVPLHWAAQDNHPYAIKALKALVEKGADLNIRDGNYGRTTLHFAAEYGHLDMVKYLVDEKGVNANVKDNHGKSSLHLAAEGGYLDTVEYLVGERSIDVNVKDNYGVTPLCFAAESEKWDVVRYLVNKNADVNIKNNNNGKTSLHFAIEKGNLDIGKFLVEKGADVNAQDNIGTVPLHLAAQTGNLDTVKFLVEKGANVNARDNSSWYGGISLNYAAISGHLDIVVYLVEKRADVNAKDISNTTPLHCAAASTKNSLPIVKCLVEHGAKVNARGMDNKTPIWGGGAGADLDVIKYLVEHGAYTRIPSDQGYTLEEYIAREVLPRIYDEALRKSYYEILDYLRLHRVSGIENSEADYNKGNSHHLSHKPLPIGSNNQTTNDITYQLDNGKKAASSFGPFLFAQANVTENILVSSDQVRTSSWINGFIGQVKEATNGFNRQQNTTDHRIGYRRHKEHGDLDKKFSESITSSSARPSSWINDLFGWVKDSVGRLLSSQVALPGTQSLPKESTSNSKPKVTTLKADLSQVDVNGTILLLDTFIRKFTGQKYISSNTRGITEQEALGYVLSVTEKVRKVVEQAALKSGISINRLNIDFMKMQEEITGKVISGKFNEISAILKSYAEKACPGREAGYPGKLSPKKFDKFMLEFNKGLLNQSIKQILHNGDGTLEVDDAKQMSLEPQSYLSNASIQSHSKDKVSTCLSDIGVTKIGGNLNR